MRVDDLREDVFFFDAARPPRAPAVRTDIVPRPLVLFFAELFFAARAVARPPAAPAFFFCAVVPARPPLAPALRTVIVLLLLFVFVLADPEVVFLRPAAVDFLAVDLFTVDRFGVDRTDAVFFRDEVPPLRDEEPPEPLLRVDEDFASPDSARCLLTVRAAISFARFVDRPCFFSESLTCSY